MKQALSFDDIRDLLRDAISQPSSSGSMGMTICDCYIEDVYPDYFIYEEGEKTFRRSYSIVDGNVTLGDPVEVEEVYVPVTTTTQSLSVIQAVKKRKGVNPKEGTAKYGDVTYADETNKKYPIDTEAHVRAALSYWGMPKNREKYSPEDQKKIGSKIRAAAKKFGISTSEAIAITVGTQDGVTLVDIKELDKEKGISAVMAGERVIQYLFDPDSDSQWTLESAANYINSLEAKKSTVLQAELGEMVNQSYLSEDVMSKLNAVDKEPFFVPLNIKYGVGSNKQAFDKAFFENAGAKFEGTPFLFNHSDLGEFGSANPVGSIVKFAGADDKGATFIAYVSASEGTLRQKIRESQALGNKGFVRKVSIEGLNNRNDYTLDAKTGIKHFHDMNMPTGIAIVNREGLKGSQITN